MLLHGMGLTPLLLSTGVHPLRKAPETTPLPCCGQLRCFHARAVDRCLAA